MNAFFAVILLASLRIVLPIFTVLAFGEWVRRHQAPTHAL